MEISAFTQPNSIEDSYYSPNIFSFTQDFDPPMTSHKRRKTDTSNDTFFYDQIEDAARDTSFSFSQDLFETVSESVISYNPTFRASSSTTDRRFQVMNQHVSDPNNQKRARPENGSGDLMQTADEAGNASSSWHSQRRLWVKNRSKAWWEQCDSVDFPEDEFKKCFRMRKATFDVICRELEPVVNKKDTMLRLAIPVRQRVAVCIWRLATGEPLREVSKRFGLGISTCHKLVLEVCNAIQDVLKPQYLNWPNQEKLNAVKAQFEMTSGMPNVGGSLYTTHVPIIAPKDKVLAYVNKKHTERNQKTSYSIGVQGVVDSNGVFTDVSIGWPGSMPDDKVLEKSSLFQRANMGLLKDVFLVGNSGHPLLDWVLVPFTHQHLTWTQHAFNERVSDVQRMAKEAFMRLKARWSCLQKRTEMKLQDLPVVLMACCVLHNICEINNEDLSPELRLEELFDDETVAHKSVRSINALHYRDQIAHKLLHHNLAATSFL